MGTDEFRCDRRLGETLSRASCNDALDQISSSDRPMRWGPRDIGFHFDLKLPARFMSCKLYLKLSSDSPDEHIEGYVDICSWEEFWEQGVAVVAMCARFGRRGIAQRLGQYFQRGGDGTKLIATKDMGGSLLSPDVSSS